MLQRVQSLLIDRFPGSDFSDIRETSNLQQILSLINLRSEAHTTFNNSVTNSIYSPSPLPLDIFASSTTNFISVGIDIQSIHEFPCDVLLLSSSTFRSHIFSPQEVAYASLRKTPIQTLVGIFSAKEAVIKSCSAVKEITFRDIQISHDSLGAPLCSVRELSGFDFKVSISHSSDYACAFALLTSTCS